ncbi:hypothetical protein C5167_035729 [Papaver somniferum]|nr:hypothetical protein C5167_035729 [Papaver somniferum]
MALNTFNCPNSPCIKVLNIPSKINKGTVKIITPVELIKEGEKVGSSEAALLAKLGIRPFAYGLVVFTVYTMAQFSVLRCLILLTKT